MESRATISKQMKSEKRALNFYHLCNDIKETIAVIATVIFGGVVVLALIGFGCWLIYTIFADIIKFAIAALGFSWGIASVVAGTILIAVIVGALIIYNRGSMLHDEYFRYNCEASGPLLTEDEFVEQKYSTKL